MLIFALEANLNFLGLKLIPKWNERQPFKDKHTQILEHLGITPDWSERPYSTIDQLKTFRESIAHGKPYESEFDEPIESAPDELDRRIDLDGEWVKTCTPDFTFNAYDDVEAICKHLFEQSRIPFYETLTRGESGLTFIEKITDR